MFNLNKGESKMKTDNAIFYINGITKEQRPLTEEQYNDNNYTLNTKTL